MTAVVQRLGRTIRLSPTEALVTGFMLALLALAAVLTVPLVAGRGGASLLPPAGKPVTVALAEFVPAHHTFGDRVKATLELAVDPERVDVSTVRPLVSLEPYRVLESARSVERAGATALVRYRLVLECLERECLAGILGRRDIAFPATKVFYAGANGKVKHVDAVWPTLRALTRVTPTDIATLPIALDAEPLTGGGRYRRDPAGLAWAASALASALVLGAAALLAQPFRRRRRKPNAAAPAVEAELDGVARAVAALEATIAPPPADERVPALDRLARELDAAGDNELAKKARRLAWGDGEISSERLEELLAACRAQAVAE